LFGTDIAGEQHADLTASRNQTTGVSDDDLRPGIGRGFIELRGLGLAGRDQRPREPQDAEPPVQPHDRLPPISHRRLAPTPDRTTDPPSRYPVARASAAPPQKLPGRSRTRHAAPWALR